MTARSDFRPKGHRKIAREGKKGRKNTMKKLNKVLVLVLSTIMVLAMSASVFANTVDSEKGGPASITITLPTQEKAPSAATTYTIYKVFDATTDGTNISYKLVNGKTTAPAGFTADANGYVTYSGTATGDDLTDADITAIKGYVTAADKVCDAVAPVGETTCVVTGLEYGYYYITTSTGTVVTVDSTKPNAEVEDKNIIPTVKKSAGTQYDAASLAAIAAVGTSQSFTAVVPKTHGATNMVFTDTMTNMTYNDDVVITVSAGTAPTAAQAVVTKTATGFTVEFDNDYIAGLADGTDITLVYSGTITSEALSVNPAKNKATISSGDGNTYDSEEVKVYNAKISVIKHDNSNKPLAGAGFVLKNADGKYYKFVAATDTASAKIEWVDSIDDATEYTSGADGKLDGEFKGLANGTYTLEEKTVPNGYNKAADQNVTIKDKDYSVENLEQEATVVNNPGVVMPGTGGIGTTIFYILGSLLVVGCGIVLVSRKRMQNK